MSISHQRRRIATIVTLATAWGVIGSCGNDQPSAPEEPPTPDLDMAFTQDGDIYRIHADGTGLVNLTTSLAGPSSGPDWSPDGTVIVFASIVDPMTGDAGIFTMTPDGGAITAVMPGNGAVWSRDGRLAVSLEGPNPFEYLVVVANADGSGQVPIATATCPLGATSWSPDGTRVVGQLSACSHGGLESHVVVANTDGSGGLVDLGPGRDPSWSPDGTEVLFNDTTGLLVMNPDGSGRTQVRVGGSGATWSSDGSYIGFVDRDANGQVDLYIMKADAAGERRVTNTPQSEAGPTIGPPQ